MAFLGQHVEAADRQVVFPEPVPPGLGRTVGLVACQHTRRGHLHALRGYAKGHQFLRPDAGIGVGIVDVPALPHNRPARGKHAIITARLEFLGRRGKRVIVTPTLDRKRPGFHPLRDGQKGPDEKKDPQRNNEREADDRQPASSREPPARFSHQQTAKFLLPVLG